MGGVVGFKLAALFPARLTSFVAGGTDPYHSAAENEEPDGLSLVFEQGTREGPQAMVAGMEALFGPISPQYAER